MNQPDWRQHPGAVSQVATLLDQSGVPLEARLARSAQAFAARVHDQEHTIVRTESLVYGDRSPGVALREIDQLLTMYEEFELGDHLGIQLCLYVPMEAKHRKGAKFFGVEVGGPALGPGSVPVSGSLSLTSLVRYHVARELPAFMLDVVPRRLAGLIFREDGVTPDKTLDEQLIYKASASLYDFILSTSTSASEELVTAKMSREGALDEFFEYCQAKRYSPLFVARRWCSEVSPERAKAYAEAVTGDGRVYFMIEMFCPMVCVDAALYSVELGRSGNLANYMDEALLVSSVRIADWQSRRGRSLAVAGPEAVTTVVNVAGVDAALTDLHDYFQAVKASLSSAPSEVIERALFEQDFLAAVRAQTDDEDDWYRSDLHFDLP